MAKPIIEHDRDGYRPDRDADPTPYKEPAADTRGVLDRLLDPFGSWMPEPGLNRQSDWSAKMQEFWLQRQLELDARQYNRNLQLEDRDYQFGLLQNQRAYDSPQALLQRLMATGMSRTAALSLLAGGAGGAGGAGIAGSTDVPYGAASSTNFSGVTPSGSIANTIGAIGTGVQAATSIASAVFGGISAYQSLRMFPLQKQLVEAQTKNLDANTSLQHVQRVQAQQVQNALGMTSFIMSGVQQALDNGTLLKMPTNMQELGAAIAQIGDPGLQEEYRRGLKMPGVRQMLSDSFNQDYQNKRNPLDLRFLRGSLITQSLDQQKISAETAKVRDEQQQIRAAIKLIGAQTGLAEAQTANTIEDTQLKKYQEHLTFMQDLLTREQLQELTLANDLMGNKISMLQKLDTFTLSTELAKWQALANDPEALQAAVSEFVTDTKNRDMLSRVMYAKYQYELGILDQYNKDPEAQQLVGVFCLMDDLHMDKSLENLYKSYEYVGPFHNQTLKHIFQIQNGAPQGAKSGRVTGEGFAFGSQVLSAFGSEVEFNKPGQ